jgi:glycosyltransferase involved in cell wall biosynthesis
MRRKPAISVILPFYNSEATLERAVLSILRQSFSDFELILVNNNSRDKGKIIAANLAKKDSRIVLLDENKQGVVYATDKGFNIAIGKYTCRMDADDEALPSKLELQFNYLENHADCDALASQAIYVAHSDQTEGFARFVEWSNSILSYEQIKNNRFIELPVINPTLMWRTETARQHGLYRLGDFPEDYEMILRWLDAGLRIEKLPVPLLKWYDSESRLTRTEEIYSDQSFYKIKSKYLSICLEKINPFHPKVSVWGASRISRRRAKILEKFGIEIHSYIDTKQSRQIEKEVIFYEDLPEAGSLFILSYIKQMNNRDRIRSFLNEKGYEEGKDYLMVS